MAAKESDKRNDDEWCKGFLLGFVQSVVSVHWSDEFLEPNLAQKNAYWLKAILLYLDSYQEARLHVNRLYLRLLDEDDSVIKTEDDRISHRSVSDLQANENWQRARTYLDEHLVADITTAIHNEKGVDVGSLNRHFTVGQLTELVNSNPYL